MHERLELPSHELIALRSQNAMLKNALLNERDASRASGIEMEEQLKAVTAQRDRLAEALESIVGESAYEGLPELKQLAIEEVLQSLREDQ